MARNFDQAGRQARAGAPGRQTGNLTHTYVGRPRSQRIYPTAVRHRVHGGVFTYGVCWTDRVGPRQLLTVVRWRDQLRWIALDELEDAVGEVTVERRRDGQTEHVVELGAVPAAAGRAWHIEQHGAAFLLTFAAEGNWPAVRIPMDAVVGLLAARDQADELPEDVAQELADEGLSITQIARRLGAAWVSR
jgi:hypothetical protein